MALGNLTYKTPNPVSNVDANLTAFEGCGVYLSGAYTVDLAVATSDLPYGIIVVGADGITPGTYPSQVAASALEIVDAYGAVIQAKAGAGGVSVGDSLQVNNAGAFVAAAGAVNTYVWGYALTDAAAGQQFLMRFAPYKVFSLT